ncbi:LacI family DNA-binding transcriptional regulator [Curtobacterium ammoniigenes]|uniref:LacI family DNA-binding transcriptional regulator n=1 Tax=Curtobacterium ammoniigenes TaxID=395387 RepID=UPI00083090AE|nr:LacI family DNA-binding transcriptional regulator [Curtobacterium ammoniigenes]
MKPATIYDVARRAGVSHQTVSRYVSGFEGIRPATRERVESAIAELGYRRNSAARQLRTRRINRLGVLAHRIDQTGPARVITGATRAAQEHGFLLDIVVTHDLDLDSIDTALAVVAEHQVLGVLAAAQTELVLERIQLLAPTVPFVMDSKVAFPAGGPSFNEFAGQLAADHLMDLGHRNVGYVSGPVDWIGASGRLAGFLARIRERGGTVRWTRAGDWSAGSGYAAWESLSADEREVTAIATGNDSMAIGLISAAQSSGITVPTDLSVIGNDDMEETRFLLPALTTIALDFEGEGRAMVESLLAKALPEQFPGDPTEVGPPRLITRASTQAAR